jgi:hypothetical protein
MNSVPFTRAKGLSRFDDLIFSPLDMPAPPSVDADRFVQWMNSDEKQTGQYFRERYERLTGLRYPWLMRSISGDLQPLQEAYPEVFDYAMSFPFKKVRAVIFLAQDGYQSVFPHADSDGLVGMRFYLANKNVEGLHFYKGREAYDFFDSCGADKDGQPRTVHFDRYFKMDEPVYARFPEGSRTFMLNSARAVHSVDANTCRVGDRIAVLVQGELDYPKLNALLEASVQRYGEYGIWF